MHIANVDGIDREQSEVVVVVVYYHIELDEIHSVVLNENLDGEMELHLHLQGHGTLSSFVAEI